MSRAQGVVDPIYVALDAERRRQGVDIKDWACAAEVHLSTVYKLLRGDSSGHVAIARALAAALDYELTVHPRPRPERDAGAGPDRGG